MAGNDPELAAMSLINQALGDLEPEAVARVLRWARDRFAPTLASVEQEGETEERRGAGHRTGEAQGLEEIADLIDATSPKTGAERALVTAYWFQVEQGNANVTGQQVNDELKNLGIGITNVTMAFDDLMKRKPALAMQVQKSGKSRQARKKYKLTGAGIRHVERMLRGEDEEG
jgi:hypothetical protein